MSDESARPLPSVPQRSIRIVLDDEGGTIYGTIDGYKALAAALLRAVDDPKRSAAGQLVADVDLAAILAPDSDLPEFAFHVVDELPPRERREQANGGCAIGWLILVAIALFVVLAAIGVGAIVNHFGLWSR